MQGQNGVRAALRMRRLIAAIAVAAALPAHAYTCQSNASGNWTAAATWINCGGGTPGAGDAVEIRNANVVTIPNNTAVAALSVTFTASNGGARLNHGNAGSSIVVGSGGVSINGPTNNATKAWNINAGSGTVNGPVMLNGGSNNSRIARIEISTGTVAVNGTTGTNGDIAMNAVAAPRAVLALTGKGSVTVTGSVALAGGVGTVTSVAGASFTYTSSSSATVATGATVSYGYLTIAKGSGVATTLDTPGTPRALTVASDLAVSSGTLNVTNVTATISGTTTVGGTLALTGASGTKTLAGQLTVSPGGTWSNGANANVTLRHGLANNGSFASGTGTYIFDANDQMLAGGSIVFDGNVQVTSGVALTNNTVTTVNGNFVGGGAGSSTGTFINAAGARLNIGGDMAGLNNLNASATNNTVDYIGGAARTAKFSAYYHLTVSATGTVMLAGNTTIAGNLTTNGNFDPSANSRTVTFTGTVPQAIVATGGAGSLTFYNLTINNQAAAIPDRNVTLGMNVTVSSILQLSNGRIVAGSGAGACTSGYRVTIPASGLVTGATGSPANRYVAGRLEKFVNNGNPVITFEVGTAGAAEPALGYSPVMMAFSFVAGLGGNLIVCPTLGDHSQIGSSQLDATKSVNRYWTLAVSGKPGDLGSFTADTIFTFVNTSSSVTDVDTGADTALLEAQRWDGATWMDGVAGMRTSTTMQVLNVTTLGDFAVAERGAGGSPVGGFNAMDAPTCAVMGVIRTKVAAAATAVNIVALRDPPTTIRTNFNGTVRVEIVDSSGGGVCAAWPLIQLLPDVAFSGADNGCKATAAFSVPNSWPNARVRVSYNLGKPSQVIACSGDNFAIRPNALVNVNASDTDWATPGTARALSDTAFGATTHKAGRPFTVRAAAWNAAGAVTANYAGTPTATLSGCAGAACTTTQGALTLDTSFAAGQLLTHAASYAEVGSYALELKDTAFANVDLADGTPADCSSSGRYVCQQGGPIAVGRFVPDHFAVAYNAPTFVTACGAGTYTYVGQPFSYGVPPVITLTAQNAANVTTALYAGAHWRIANAVLASYGNKSYTTASGTLVTSAAPSPDPVIAVAGGGTGTLTFGTGAAFYFDRTAPLAPFNAEVSLAINVIDADNVAYAANPARFGQATPGSGIAYTAGKEMRYGRLMIGSANGSQLLPLRMPIEAQYWNGTSFVTNTADGCTALAGASLGLSSYTQNLGDTPACETSALLGGSFAAGRGSLRLAAPGSGNNGGVDVTVNLADPASGNACLANGAPPVPPASAGLPWLRVKGTGAAYDRNPKARARFGAYRASEDYIDVREVYW
jgi:hypothetical protein